MMEWANNFENESVFLKMPHLCKPLQVVNAVVLAICVASTAGGDNGVLWFIIICSLLISVAATAVFAMKCQDQLMDSLSNGSLTWNIVEMVYSFVLAVLSAISVWLSFGFANRHLGGTSAGYIAAGLFFIIHTVLYTVPCIMIYDSVQANGLRGERNDVQIANPFPERGYQEDV